MVIGKLGDIISKNVIGKAEANQNNGGTGRRDRGGLRHLQNGPNRPKPDGRAHISRCVSRHFPGNSPASISREIAREMDFAGNGHPVEFPGKCGRRIHDSQIMPRGISRLGIQIHRAMSEFPRDIWLTSQIPRLGRGGFPPVRPFWPHAACNDPLVTISKLRGGNSLFLK